MFGAFGVVLGFQIGRALRDAPTGCLVALLLCVSPWLWFTSTRVLLDPAQAVMLLWSADRLLRFERTRRTRDALWLGLALGLTLMTKNKGMLMLGLAGFYFVLESGLAPLLEGRSPARRVGERLRDGALWAAGGITWPSSRSGRA